MITFAPIQFDAASLERYCALFAACFPGTTRFTAPYLAWQYIANPDGQAVGFDAWEGDQLAAHYVCLPAEATVDGRPARVLLSLNTATAPAFQGKGLFTKLAALTYEAGAAAGFDGVYGVANGNSTPGFIRKLAFQLVCPLDAKVGIGGIGERLGGSQDDTALSFERRWNSESLAWRCASPFNPVRGKHSGGRWSLHAPALSPMVPAYAELSLPAGIAPAIPAVAAPPLRLYLGLLPRAARGVSLYASIPRRLRPSPLNLIYRAFTAAPLALDPDRIRFTFLDFDAY